MKDWNENRLNNELDALMNEMPEQDELEKKIEQYITRKVRRIVIRTVTAIACVLIVLLLIINPMMNAMYLNPYKLNGEPEHGGAEASTYLNVMRDYWETVQPYVEISTIDVEKKGFAKYEVEMSVNNHIGSQAIGAINVWCEVVRGKYVDIQDANRYLTHIMGRFDSCWYEEDESGELIRHSTTKEEYIEEFQELPASATIYLSISTETPKNVEELRKENFQLKWIEVYQPNVDFQGGLNMDLTSMVDAETDHRSVMSEEELIQAYVANLENLIAYPEIWKEFGLKSSYCIWPDGNHSLLKATYEDAKNLEILQSKNFCISGEKEDIIKYLQKTDVFSIHIDKITLT